MSVDACVLDSETVAGMPGCTTPSYAYLTCIVRIGTGTDPLGMCTGTNLIGNAYRYRYQTYEVRLSYCALTPHTRVGP